jgi:hypothetical protein
LARRLRRKEETLDPQTSRASDRAHSIVSRLPRGSGAVLIEFANDNLTVTHHSCLDAVGRRRWFNRARLVDADAWTVDVSEAHVDAPELRT